MKSFAKGLNIFAFPGEGKGKAGRSPTTNMFCEKLFKQELFLGEKKKYLKVFDEIKAIWFSSSFDRGNKRQAVRKHEGAPRGHDTPEPSEPSVFVLITCVPFSCYSVISPFQGHFRAQRGRFPPQPYIIN